MILENDTSLLEISGCLKRGHILYKFRGSKDIYLHFLDELLDKSSFVPSAGGGPANDLFRAIDGLDATTNFWHNADQYWYDPNSISWYQVIY